MNKLSFILGVGIILTGCGASSDENIQKINRIKFDSYYVEGTALDARATGFTECSSDYYQAICWKRHATIFGVPTDAVVRMDLTEGKMPADLAQLHYTSVGFDLPAVRYRDSCSNNDPDKPLKCDQESSTLNLQRKLIASGWEMDEWRSHRTYYHKKFPVVVTVELSTAPGYDNAVSLSYEDPGDVAAAISKIKQERAQRKSAQQGEAAFREKMATGN